MNKTKLPGFLSLLSESVKFYKKHAKSFILLSLWPFTIVVVISILQHSFLPQEGLAFVIGGLVLSIILSVVQFFIQTLMYPVALIENIQTADSDIGYSTKNTYSKSMRLVLPLLFILILSSLIVITGFTLLIIPGIILAVYFTFCVYALVIDGKRGLKALTTSYYYIQYDWWDVVLRIFLLALIPVIFSGIVFVLLFLGLILLNGGFDYSAIMGMTHSVSASFSGSLGYYLVIYVWQFVYLAVFLPISAIYLYQIYKRLKSSRGEPKEADINTTGFFMGFAIVGFLIAVLFIGISMVFGIWGAYNKAKLKAISTSPQNLQLNGGFNSEVNSLNNSQIPNSALLGGAQEFPIGDIGLLTSTPRKNKDLGFQIQIPKGWVVYDDKDSSLISPSGAKPEASLTAVKVKLPVRSLNTSQDQVAADVLDTVLQDKELRNAETKTYMLNGRQIYCLKGVLTAYDGSDTYADYCVFTKGLQAFALYIWSSKKDLIEAENILFTSMSTFEFLDK